MSAPDPDRVKIFDTTLRDGEQSPGCSMTLDEKLRIANALAELGVDIIEAGFPAASPGDWEAVAAVARESTRARRSARSRAARATTSTGLVGAGEAARHACTCSSPPAPFTASTSSRWRASEIVRLAVEGVRHARRLCDDVEFSPEDASRTEHEFLAEVVQAVVDAGATTVNIPDTVGYTTPQEFHETFAYLRRTCRHRVASRSRCIATTTSAWRSRTA